MRLFDKIKAKFNGTKLGKFINKKLGPQHWYVRYLQNEPVQEKTILYLAYRNNIMGGNPYAIFCELMSRPEYKDYKHIWVYGAEKSLKDDTFERYSSYPNVICVKARTEEYCKYLATAQYIICNSSIPSWASKRPEQIYINTWHGVPLKTLGRDAKDRSALSISNSQRNFFFCDYMVMPNEYTIDKMIGAYDLKGMMTGKIINAGYPRTDLVANTSKNYIRGILELKLGYSLEGKKLVLYAPTFRTKQGKSVNTAREVGEYMQSLLEILPPDYELIFKVHNMMARFFKNNKKMRSRLVFDEIETNELLSVTDVLITDYSSIFFDFLCTKKPILFFDYDKEEYSDGRGLYIPLEELPGAVCETIKEMEENFQKIEDGTYDYSENYGRFLREFACNDDGGASKRVVDIIFDKKDEVEQKYIYRQKDSGERILVIGSSRATIENKGECIRVLHELDTEKNTVAFMAPYVYLYGEELDEMLKKVRAITFEPDFLLTFKERLLRKLFHRVPNSEEFYERQYTNYFGKLHFSRIIDLKGEDSPWKPVLSKHCDKYETRIIEDTPELKVERREAVGRMMTVLFLATFDSVNYVYVNLIKELEKRGYRVILAVWNADDTFNNRMFIENDIPFVDVADFDLKELSQVDMVIYSPFKVAKFTKIVNQINSRGIFCIGFMSLFSSILMRPYTDMIFTVGKSKFEEFEENGLRYNVVSVGNPQYDGLVGNFSKPRIIDQKDIKRVLIVDQGGYPFGTEGKKLLGDTILAMAKKHPDKHFVVKPRYLPDDIGDGKILHKPSEHLYDFIPDPPSNLELLREPTILEDIIVDFDAMVTMWSTAYLDAAMRNMPIMLISGFPSEEVMDVRVQRIEEAYAHLEKTGCIVDYKEVLAGKLEFNYVNDEYLKGESENAGQPCAPNIVDILEDIYKYWIVYGVRQYEVFQMDSATFREKLPSIKTAEADSDEYTQRRSFMIWFNDRMQDLAFLNRSMAKPFDFSPLMKYWEFFPPKNFGKGSRNRLELKVKLATEKIKRGYFNSSKIKTETDGIRLDYYYDRLFVRKHYNRIKTFDNPNVYPETKAFYMSMIHLQERKYKKAAEEFSEYYHIAEALNVKPIAKDRKVVVEHIPNGPEIEEFFKYLLDMREYDILKELCAARRFNAGLRKRYLTKVLRAENLPTFDYITKE